MVIMICLTGAILHVDIDGIVVMMILIGSTVVMVSLILLCLVFLVLFREIYCVVSNDKTSNDKEYE